VLDPSVPCGRPCVRVGPCPCVRVGPCIRVMRAQAPPGASPRRPVRARAVKLALGPVRSLLSHSALRLGPPRPGRPALRGRRVPAAPSPTQRVSDPSPMQRVSGFRGRGSELSAAAFLGFRGRGSELAAPACHASGGAPRPPGPRCPARPAGTAGVPQRSRRRRRPAGPAGDRRAEASGGCAGRRTAGCATCSGFRVQILDAWAAMEERHKGRAERETQGPRWKRGTRAAMEEGVTQRVSDPSPIQRVSTVPNPP
jgi:hypothetical protein